MPNAQDRLLMYSSCGAKSLLSVKPIIKSMPIGKFSDLRVQTIASASCA